MRSSDSRTILVVDDVDAIRKMVTILLARNGYHCLEAAGGADALELLQTSPENVHLVLTDVVMPGMNGPELAARAARVRPDVRVLFMSGYSDDPMVRSVAGTPVFLPKPFTPAALAETVRLALEQPRYQLPDATPGAAPR